LLEDGHLAFGKIAGPETIKHDNNGSLEGTFLVLALQDTTQTRGHGSGGPILENCPAAM
jgi:hypothetical protein